MNGHSLLFQFVTTVVYWCGVVVLVIGVLITIAPRLVIRIGEFMNRWISTDEMFHRLDAPRPTERWFYRHHRLAGALLILGAAYVIYTFLFVFNLKEISRDILLFRSRVVTEWLLSSMEFLNVGFGAIAVIIGAVIFLRPSLIKGIEQRANRWYGVDDSLKGLDVQMKAPDSLFRRHPRHIGEG